MPGVVDFFVDFSTGDELRDRFTFLLASSCGLVSFDLLLVTSFAGLTGLLSRLAGLKWPKGLIICWAAFGSLIVPAWIAAAAAAAAAIMAASC